MTPMSTFKAVIDGDQIQDDPAFQIAVGVEYSTVSRNR